MAKHWYVYMVECADGSLYTGVATDVERRVEEHNSQTLKAAKYTRARQPVTLAYQSLEGSRSEACRREWEIKQLSRSQKLRLIQAK